MAILNPDATTAEQTPSKNASSRSIPKIVRDFGEEAGQYKGPSEADCEPERRDKRRQKCGTTQTREKGTKYSMWSKKYLRSCYQDWEEMGLMQELI